MLNRDLLQFTRNSGRITPRFCNPTPPELAMGETLLSIYHEAYQQRLPRARIEENLEPFIKAALHTKLIAGLNKLILDHSEFASNGANGTAPELRKSIFTAAAQFMSDLPADPAQYRQLVQQHLPENLTLPQDIYSDLPEFDILSQVPQWSSTELYNIYNIALVQGVLFYAESLELSLADPEPMVIRKFLRRLKFYRLLAEVKKASAHEVKLTLSGPAALFGENRKYGLQLAAFFPVILLLKEWKIRASVKIRDDAPPDTLSLSSAKCQLKGTLRRWAACVPDEVLLFIKAFQQEATDWQLAAESDLPRLVNCGTVIPDFSFAPLDAPNQVIHVELFHRYYHNGLEDQLEFLSQHSDYPLIIGIDRFLLGKASEKEFALRYENFNEYAFFYSSYPGVDRVRKMLAKALDRKRKKLL